MHNLLLALGPPHAELDEKRIRLLAVPSTLPEPLLLPLLLELELELELEPLSLSLLLLSAAGVVWAA